MKPAICTQCGANIEVDETREAGICTHCGTAFITEKAINNYNTTHVHQHNVTENITKIIYGNEKDTAQEYFNRGLTYLKLKEYPSAFGEFAKAKKESPECAKYWFYEIVASTHNFTFALGIGTSIKNFLALATEEEKAQYGREYGICLSSYELFWVGWFLRELDREGKVSIFPYMDEVLDDQAAARKFLTEILNKNLNTENKTAFAFIVKKAFLTLGKPAEFAADYYKTVNFAIGEEFKVNDVSQFMVDGVFYCIPPASCKKVVVLDNVRLERVKLAVPHIIRQRIDVVELTDDSTVNLIDAFKLVGEQLILPKKYNSLGDFSREQWPAAAMYKEIIEREMPPRGIILHFRGKCYGKALYMKLAFYENNEYVWKKFCWCQISEEDNTIWGEENTTATLLEKYYGKPHGFTPITKLPTAPKQTKEKGDDKKGDGKKGGWFSKRWEKFKSDIEKKLK